MQLKLAHAWLAVSTAILLSAAPSISQQQPRLSNTDIVKMVKDGMADSAITSAIAAVTPNLISPRLAYRRLVRRASAAE